MDSNNISFISRLNLYLGLLIVMVLPLYKRIVPYIIVAWGITWVLEMGFNRRFMNYRLPGVILLIVFYFIHISGLIHTENINAGLFDLEVKATLLIFPLLFIGVNCLYKKKMSLILSGFVMGNCLASLICLVIASYNYIFLGQNTFFYNPFSVLHHPSYFSMYLVFSIVILFEYFDKPGAKGEISLYNFRYILAALFLLMIFLLLSKAGIICAFVVFIGLIIRQINKTDKYVRYLILLSGIIALFVFTIFNNYRFRSVEKVMHEEIDVRTSESSGVRLLIWKTSLDIIKENLLFGVGTGDVKDKLVSRYRSNNMEGAEKRSLNAHNQYIETTIGQGVLGLVVLLFVLIIPFVHGIRKGNYLLVFLIFIAGFNFLFESMLNTAAGVIFFSFFYSYLYIFKPGKANNAVNSS